MLSGCCLYRVRECRRAGLQMTSHRNLNIGSTSNHASDSTCSSSAVEKRGRSAGGVRTTSMMQVMAWLRSNDPQGAGLPLTDADSSTVPALFASFEGLAHGSTAVSAA